MLSNRTGLKNRNRRQACTAIHQCKRDRIAAPILRQVGGHIFNAEPAFTPTVFWVVPSIGLINIYQVAFHATGKANIGLIVIGLLAGGQCFAKSSNRVATEF